MEQLQVIKDEALCKSYESLSNLEVGSKEYYLACKAISELEREIAERNKSENESEVKRKDIAVRFLESGLNVLVASMQMIVFITELRNTREFETSNTEVSTAFRKIWTIFGKWK